MVISALNVFKAMHTLEIRHDALVPVLSIRMQIQLNAPEFRQVVVLMWNPGLVDVHHIEDDLSPFSLTWRTRAMMTFLLSIMAQNAD